jgi:hypothetical protein
MDGSSSGRKWPKNCPKRHLSPLIPQEKVRGQSKNTLFHDCHLLAGTPLILLIVYLSGESSPICGNSRIGVFLMSLNDSIHAKFENIRKKYKKEIDYCKKHHWWD